VDVALAEVPLCEPRLRPVADTALGRLVVAIAQTIVRQLLHLS
jgi:hypothetical protein